MPPVFTSDHLGRLVIECRGEVTVEAPGIPMSEAEGHLAALAERRTTRFTDETGILYVVDGLSVVVAHWEPNR